MNFSRSINATESRNFYFKTESDGSIMIPAVVLVLVLVSSSFSHPLTNKEFGTTGTQTAHTVGEFVSPQGTTTGEKTAGVPTQVTQNVEKTQNYLGTGQQTTQVHPNTPVQYSQQVEKTGVHPSEGYTSQQYTQNTPTSKGGNVPTGFEQTQTVHTPVGLPVQPLTVVPFNQVSELVQPVVIPAEVETSRRIILMAIEPIPQGNIQGITITPEEQVQNQKVAQPVTYSAQVVGQTNQPFAPQQVGKQQVQPYGQTHVPVQEQLGQGYVKEQAIQQPTLSVQNYNPTAQPSAQVFSVQPNVQSVVNQEPVPQQSTRYNPEQVQPQQQNYNIQQGVEKQGEVQQVTSYTPSQVVEPGYQQQQYPVTVTSGNVQPYQQQEGFFQKQASNPSHQTQQVYTGEKQTPFQQVTDYTTSQSQQQVSVQQPENYQGQVQYQPVKHSVQPEYQTVPQVYNVPPQHQEGYTSVQPQSVQQIEKVNQAAEKQLPVQQPIQTEQISQTYPQGVIPQQQVSTFQPYLVNPIEALQPEITGQVPQVLQTITPVQASQQVYVAQPQQDVNYTDKNI